VRLHLVALRHAVARLRLEPLQLRLPLVGLAEKRDEVRLLARADALRGARLRPDADLLQREARLSQRSPSRGTHALTAVTMSCTWW